MSAMHAPLEMHFFFIFFAPLYAAFSGVFLIEHQGRLYCPEPIKKPVCVHADTPGVFTL
jgi:hypothetical protein